MNASLRIGVLKLADSAPVIMAQRKGLFARHGITAEIVVSPSWANIADGLAWNRLDAAVIFAPLAMMTALGRRGHDTVLRPISRISRGGNTIVFRGVNPAAGTWSSGPSGRRAFDAWAATLGHRPRLAVVHMYSTHLLILRRFLKMIGVDGDNEVDFLVMPPTDMINALSERAIDGGCVGPPWGTEAERLGLAFHVGGSCTVLPGHVEKIFVASERLFTSGSMLENLKNSLQDSLIYCDQPEYGEDIARQLALPLNEGGLSLPLATTQAVLPGGSAREAVAFAGGSLGAPDVDWVIEDMTALGWLNAAERETLTHWIETSSDNEAVSVGVRSS